MNTPESPNEFPRPAAPARTPAEQYAAAQREKSEKLEKLARNDDFQPRYVELPDKLPGGTRNLLLGVGFFIVAFFLAAIASLLSGAHALVPIVTVLVAAGLMWVLSRLDLFRQRNGAFLALALLSVLGSGMALGERGYVLLDEWLKGARGVDTSATLAPAPALATEVPKAAGTLNLSQELGIVQPDKISGPAIKLLSDTPVLVGAKVYLLKTGDVFALEEVRDSQVTFIAKDLHPRISRDAVELLNTETPSIVSAAPSDSSLTPAQITKKAQAEAIRRFPALGVKNSPENLLFLEMYRELKNAESPILKDPEWPLDVAESLAKRESWGKERPAPKTLETEPEPEPEPNPAAAAPAIPQLAPDPVAPPAVGNGPTPVPPPPNVE